MAKIAFIIAIISLSLGGVFLFLNYDKEFVAWLLSLGISMMVIAILHLIVDLEEFEKKYPVKYMFIYVAFIIFFIIKLPMVLESFL